MRKREQYNLPPDVQKFRGDFRSEDKRIRDIPPIDIDTSKEPKEAVVLTVGEKKKKQVAIARSKIEQCATTEQPTIHNTDETPLEEPLSQKVLKQKHTRRAGWFLAALGSVGFHVGGLIASVPEVRKRVAESARALSHELSGGDEKIKNLAKNLLDTKEKQEKNGHENIGEKRLEFFLEMLRSIGISEEEIKQTTQFFLEVRAEALTMVEEDVMEEVVLYELFKKAGRYEPYFSLISDIATKGAGNCEARVKFLILTIPTVYPDMPLKVQFYGADATHARHIRLLAKINDDWYAIEDNLPKIVHADLEGTVITDIDVFEKSILSPTQKAQSIQDPNNGSKPKSAYGGGKTNTPYSIQFEVPPTKTYGEAGQDAAETHEEYQQRLRSNFVGGEVVDPWSVPIQMYFDGSPVEKNTEEDENKKEKQEYDITKIYPLPEEVRLQALLEGKLVINYEIPDLKYDLRGLDVESITIVSRIPEISEYYATTIVENFSDIEELYFYDKSRTVDKNFIAQLVHLKKLNIDGDIPSLEMLRHLNELTRISIGESSKTNHVIDVSPLEGKQLQDLEINIKIIHAEKLNKKSLRRVFITIFNENKEELVHFLSTCPNMEEINLALDNVVGYLEIPPLETRTLKRFSFYGDKEVSVLDVAFLKNQPLEKFYSLDGIINEESLQGMPLKRVTIRLKEDTIDLSFLDTKTLKKLYLSVSATAVNEKYFQQLAPIVRHLDLSKPGALSLDVFGSKVEALNIDAVFNLLSDEQRRKGGSFWVGDDGIKFSGQND